MGEDQNQITRRDIIRRGAAAGLIASALGSVAKLNGFADAQTTAPTDAIPSTQSSSARRKLVPLGYANVKLTGGPLQVQYDYALNLFVQLDIDRALKVYRQKAGMPAPGPDMGGWYNPEGHAPGHALGQWMSALARFTAAGSGESKTKLVALIEAFTATLGHGDPFYHSRFPAYTFDKHVIGLTDAFRYAGIESARDVLERVTDIAAPYLPEKALTWGDQQARPHKDNSYTLDESYTIAENLFIAHDVFGDDRYLTLAKRFLLDEEYFDKLARGEEAMVNQHAYSWFNALGSAAMAYISLGAQKHLDAIRNAWEMIVKDQQYASGGWGPRERFVEPGKGKLFESLSTTHNHFETPCGSYAVFKLSRYLTEILADGKYGDGLERTLYNGILATKPLLPDGSTFYYSDYSGYARKTYHPDKWPCCSGTYPQAIVDYLVSAYFLDADSIYVNLYVPSEAKWKRAAGEVKITQQTDYPELGSVTVRIDPTVAEEFAVKLRIPGWASSFEAKVNGQAIATEKIPRSDGYIAIKRRWSSGDTIALNLPMEFRTEAIDASHPETVALMRGPVMYVAANDPPTVHITEPSTTPSVAIESRFKPFYKINNECYTTYLERTS